MKCIYQSYDVEDCEKGQAEVERFFSETFSIGSPNVPHESVAIRGKSWNMDAKGGSLSEAHHSSTTYCQFAA